MGDQLDDGVHAHRSLKSPRLGRRGPTLNRPGVRAPSPAPGLLLYIMVDDIDATIAAIVARGGRIVQPVGVDAPEITARFADPDGNVLGLYKEPG